MRRAAIALCLVLVASGAEAQSDAADTRALLDRAAAYVRQFVGSFANVVAEEDYRQDWQSGERRRLTSDFLLVGYPGREGQWLAFRDVTAVNGRPVRDQQDRLAQLFMDPFEDAVRRAEEISLEASRHSLVELGVLSSPLVVLAWLQPYYHQDFTHRLGDARRESGIVLRELRLEEILQPSPNLAAARRPPITAVAWVEESTGRVVKTQARMGTAPNTATSTTTFRFDETLGIDVPAEMEESRVGRSRTSLRPGVDQFTGVATYGRFRRFSVRTEEEIEKPAVNPR